VEDGDDRQRVEHRGVRRGASVVMVTVNGSGEARPLIDVAVPSLKAWAPAMPLMPPP
jgi:hypothetical protein